jgi:hypothetical protein
VVPATRKIALERLPESTKKQKFSQKRKTEFEMQNESREKSTYWVCNKKLF